MDEKSNARMGGDHNPKRFGRPSLCNPWWTANEYFASKTIKTKNLMTN